MILVGDLPIESGLYWNRRPSTGAWEVVRYVRDGFWVAIEILGCADDLTFFADDPDLDLRGWEWSGPLIPPGEGPPF